MKDQNIILHYVEPIFHFCLKRVNNRADAEDLAGEIMLHVLDGIRRYDITSADAWVWRVAHNRYARFCAARKNKAEISGAFIPDLIGDYGTVDENSFDNAYETVFRCLHTLTSSYKNILVDYYIGGMSYKSLAERYSLPETTIKWRLNVSREKIRNRIETDTKGEGKMDKTDKIYKRVNWQTSSCNGSMDPGAYLSNQVARAICEAAYEKPLGIEEISLKTGLPTMYIEDAMPRLIYGDAIKKTGNKYAADFIVLRLNDKAQIEKQFLPIISAIADYYEKLFDDCENAVESADFWGHDFGVKRLGYIALPLSLRRRVRNIKNKIPSLANGPYPPRRDGGYGWFIVEESKDESDSGSGYMSGCNVAGDQSDCIYWFNIRKYMNDNIYQNGTKWLCANKIVERCAYGVITDGILTNDDLVRLLQLNLIVKSDTRYVLNFACFTREQFAAFAGLFSAEDEKFAAILTELILSIKKSFVSFVPKRLDGQINQWISCFIHSIIGYVSDELISRGVLEKPDDEKPLTNGVFHVKGDYINV